MGYMSEKEFNSRLKKIQDKNIEKERKRKLREEKLKYFPKFKLPSTSKLVLFAVFLLCIEIIIFCQYAMIVLGDTSALYVLIGVPVSLVPVVLGYYNKSKAENSKDGITYDLAMLEKMYEKMDTSMSSDEYEFSDEAKG